MKKTIYCRKCGRKAKVTAAQAIVWRNNKLVMSKHDGPFGGWQCTENCENKKKK